MSDELFLPESLVENLNYLTNRLKVNWDKAEFGGNKSAGRRFRSATVEIEKLLKEARRYSLQAHRN